MHRHVPLQSAGTIRVNYVFTGPMQPRKLETHMSGYQGWMIISDDGDTLLLESPTGQRQRVEFGSEPEQDESEASC